MFRIIKYLSVFGITLALSVSAVLKKSVLLVVLLILVHFIIIKAIPSFRKYENIWMFLMVAVSSIPINIYVLYLLNDFGIIFESIFFVGILRCLYYYSALLCLQEIIMGIITRIIWKKQYGFVLKEGNDK